MADETLKRDQNFVTVLAGVTDDSNQFVTMLRVDTVTKRLLLSATGLPGSGTVTSVSVVSANGFAGTVATATTTPAITLSTTITGILSGNGTAISAASTTGTGAVVLATAPTFITSINVAGLILDATDINVSTNAALTVSTNNTNRWQFTAAGHYVALTDNTYDIGASGATRPRTLYLGTGATIPALTATTINGNTFTAGTYTLTGGAGKTLTFSNSLTLAGTDSTTMTFPSTTATIARTDAAQTFTGTQTASQLNLTANAITASGNAATVPITSGRNIVTNNSAATLTVTMTTASAVNMQTCMVQVLDFSAAAQTIAWVNTENSSQSVPTTSNGSATLPLTVGFVYNSNTSKWRCVANA